MVGGEMSSVLGREPADGRSAGTVITHPNRDKPVVQATRATVVLLLLASAALVLIVTIGGWGLLEPAKPIEIAYVDHLRHARLLRDALESRRPARGGRACRAAADLRARRRAQLVRARQSRLRSAVARRQPAGALTLLIAPVQILLVAFAMRGFQQGWNVELERRDPSAGADVFVSAPPQPA